MDQVFTLRFWLELEVNGGTANDWRVRIRHVNSRREYHTYGIENAFALVHALLPPLGSNSTEESR
jgi:hypothetical protein